jgi:dipeptidyl aminopeptidase/acylaminoacyl peptidase
VNGSLYWVESSPRTGGTRVVSWSPAAELQTLEPLVGSSLHAYGGGVYAITGDGAWIVFASDGYAGSADGRRSSDDPFGSDGDLWFGAGRLWIVRETGDADALLSADPASGRTAVVHRAAFIGAPQALEGRLAWVQWDAAVMPWDDAEIWVADLRDDAIADTIRVAGGPDESAIQPQWGPDGWLYFVSDRSGWWNLYRWRDGETVPVATMAAECAQAPWEAGYRSYTFLTGGRIGVIVQDGPRHRLAVIDQGDVRFLETPYTSFKPYLCANSDRMAVIGSSPTRPQQVALVATTGVASIEVISGNGLDEEIDHVVVPQVITVPADGRVITALVYEALGADVAPVIVRVHPGPTHHSELRLDWEVQYFTSRGFTVVDVDYRGSTGYGRAYRKALDGRWGQADVDDCSAVARHLIDGGSAMPGAVFITGASAGGYTAIRAVARADTPFALAAARSAIVDPVRWQHTAPRFQRPHAAILAHGDSMIKAAAVRRPVLLVHGVEDPIAPVTDAFELADALRQRNLLVELLELPGVGHYITGDALIRTLEAELAAYSTVLAGLKRN